MFTRCTTADNNRERLICNRQYQGVGILYKKNPFSSQHRQVVLLESFMEYIRVRKWFFISPCCNHRIWLKIEIKKTGYYAIACHVPMFMLCFVQYEYNSYSFKLFSRHRCLHILVHCSVLNLNYLKIEDFIILEIFLRNYEKYIFSLNEFGYM